ncbi:MAG: MFS transporter [Gaiellaceae bacterium]
MAYAALLALAALDAAGYSVIAPVIPEIGERTGAGPAVAGALVAAFALGQLGGFPLAGRVVSRRGAVAVFGGSLALVAVGDLGFILTERLEVFFPARLLQGVGAAGLWLGVVFGVLERFPGQEYRRLTGVLAAYSVGGIAGPGIAAAGGIAAPFAIHLALVGAAAGVVLALGSPRERPAFASDRAALLTPGFRLASAGVLIVALGLGVLDGPLPLHFAIELSQAEIAGLYVGGSIVLGVASAAAGSFRPGPMLWLGALATTAGIALAGATGAVPLWLAAVALVGVGLGLGEAGALGILLQHVGVERIVLAMVVWSQVWAVGYLVGPSVAGAVAEGLGFAALGVVPAAGLLLLAAVTPRRPATRG